MGKFNKEGFTKLVEYYKKPQGQYPIEAINAAFTALLDDDCETVHYTRFDSAILNEIRAHPCADEKDFNKAAILAGALDRIFKQICTDCKGTGEIDDMPCRNCAGCGGVSGTIEPLYHGKVKKDAHTATDQPRSQDTNGEPTPPTKDEEEARVSEEKILRKLTRSMSMNDIKSRNQPSSSGTLLHSISVDDDFDEREMQEEKKRNLDVINKFLEEACNLKDVMERATNKTELRRANKEWRTALKKSRKTLKGYRKVLRRY